MLRCKVLQILGLGVRGLLQYGGAAKVQSNRGRGIPTSHDDNGMGGKRDDSGKRGRTALCNAYFDNGDAPCHTEYTERQTIAGR